MAQCARVVRLCTITIVPITVMVRLRRRLPADRPRTWSSPTRTLGQVRSPVNGVAFWCIGAYLALYPSARQEH
jgi:hypothetical protein